jgi:hypothetical protein
VDGITYQHDVPSVNQWSTWSVTLAANAGAWKLLRSACRQIHNVGKGRA